MARDTAVVGLSNLLPPALKRAAVLLVELVAGGVVSPAIRSRTDRVQSSIETTTSVTPSKSTSGASGEKACRSVSVGGSATDPGGASAGDVRRIASRFASLSLCSASAA